MTEENFVDPSRAQFNAFKALPRDVPINMLNLVRFRATATYPADHDCAANGWSGAQAYAAYSRATGPLLAGVGGRIIWQGKMDALLIGPDAEHWDASFIVHYPHADAFLAMVSDAAYQRAVIHRQAAVETSRLIRYAPGATGSLGAG